MLPTGSSPNEAIRYLSLEQVLATHAALVKRYGGREGVRDKGLLESAVFRPQASVFGQEAYPTLFEKCAVLGYSLMRNHPFLNGNKRIGFAAMHLMLLINGYDLNSTAEEEVTMAEDVAAGRIHESEIIQWLKQHSKKQSSG